MNDTIKNNIDKAFDIMFETANVCINAEFDGEESDEFKDIYDIMDKLFALSVKLNTKKELA